MIYTWRKYRNADSQSDLAEPKATHVNLLALNDSLLDQVH